MLIRIGKILGWGPWLLGIWGLDSPSYPSHRRTTPLSSKHPCIYAFVILPDGQVTVCEELYWHPQFIIGDLTHQSITEMWNSSQALALYNISTERVRTESECKTCDDFDPCHKNKGLCWKEVLYAYGMENWDYPDPRCHLARLPLKEFFLS